MFVGASVGSSDSRCVLSACSTLCLDIGSLLSPPVGGVDFGSTQRSWPKPHGCSLSLALSSHKRVLRLLSLSGQSRLGREIEAGRVLRGLAPGALNLSYGSAFFRLRCPRY